MMDSKDADQRSSVSQSLGAGDAKPAQPPSSVKSEVRRELWTASCIAVIFSL